MVGQSFPKIRSATVGLAGLKPRCAKAPDQLNRPFSGRGNSHAMFLNSPRGREFLWRIPFGIKPIFRSTVSSTNAQAGAKRRVETALVEEEERSKEEKWFESKAVRRTRAETNVTETPQFLGEKWFAFLVVLGGIPRTHCKQNWLTRALSRLDRGVNVAPTLLGYSKTREHS